MKKLFSIFLFLLISIFPTVAQNFDLKIEKNYNKIRLEINNSKMSLWLIHIDLINAANSTNRDIFYNKKISAFIIPATLNEIDIYTENSDEPIAIIKPNGIFYMPSNNSDDYKGIEVSSAPDNFKTEYNKLLKYIKQNGKNGEWGWGYSPRN